ncbi:MAG: isochorismatase family protein [Chrysiogenales bacterium]|nr:MAG: isochorismatase family protein [Chrysiogenales bacterium]
MNAGDAIEEWIISLGSKPVILCGIETHICVLAMACMCNERSATDEFTRLSPFFK